MEGRLFLARENVCM